ncbi:GPI ethanolamine phosphate transferase 1 isoform X2 [Aristolochia californica]|uniref:GPI ethanolamine phosphate transferase 1 isoform X2 n=1 Tax=Aristolochia californica TaxID=171875 RepID=UPI0035E0A890
MRGDGILDSLHGDQINAAGTHKRDRLKSRERWLVVLGVVLHSVYLLSIFDIYFKTPIVHGMEPVKPRFVAPAKRLVLLVADGLRADKFFEPDLQGKFRAPFLRSIMKTKGRWGVSHARPPTESRPGHVSIIAGFYEDPSAVTKGWKANPVEFDTVFNRSQHTISFGSPDIVPIFCSALSHSTWNTYPHEFEDFASDASFLDHWSFDQFQSLLNKSHEDPRLKELLLQDNLVVFLHLLGCDTNGHAHKPYSSIYLNNVKVVDHITKSVYDLVEGYFKDNRTAYIFTADHGMSDKGSHGDGHPTNTDTPLVAWGAGIRNPNWLSHASQVDDGFRFVDDHVHDMPTPVQWGLGGLERIDVNQADIAPLMAAVLGLPCPVNSVGSLPLGYINLNKAEEVEAVLANTKQVLNQFLRKSQLKQSNSLQFKPFKPLANYSYILVQIEDLMASGNFQPAMDLSLNLRRLALEGLHYFQTYDWLMLMTTVTLGYIGWMFNLVLHVLKFYTSLIDNAHKTRNTVVYSGRSTRKVDLCGFLVMGMLSGVLFFQNSPFLYHIYVAMTVFLWTQILKDTEILKVIWRYLSSCKFSSHVKLFAICVSTILILEFLVMSFSDRRLYTWCFLLVGVAAALFASNNIPGSSVLPIFTLVTCWFLSIFTLMPAEIPDSTQLVLASGATIIVVGMAGRWFDFRSRGSKCWFPILNHDIKAPQLSKLFLFQVLLVGLSSGMVWLCTSHRTQKQELLTLHQLINWFLVGVSVVLPFFSPTSLMSRLLSIFLGFAPPFLLLSIGYEALFYSAFSLTLTAWLFLECALLNLNNVQSFTMNDADTKGMLNYGERYLQLFDLRVPLIFIVLFNVAFFGTGNFASIASFEISSVYRFITVFSFFVSDVSAETYQA